MAQPPIATIMSRLDRFLISLKWLDLYPEVCQLALLKHASNHCPILLDSKPDRWGAAPFRFELYWLENKVFVTLIKDWWKKIRVDGWATFKLGLKLKMLKGKIREWSRATLRKWGKPKLGF